MSYIAILSIVVGLILLLPFLEKSGKRIIIFLMTGMFCCLFASELNNLVLKAFYNDVLYTTTTITPVLEEVIKALPVIYYAVFFSDNEKKLISVSFSIGIGFAIYENLIVLITNLGTVTVQWALIRGFGAVLIHGLCTVLVGVGVSYIRKEKKLARCGTYGLLMSAIIYHSLFNLLVQSDLVVIGAVLPVVTYIPAVMLLRRFVYAEKPEKEESTKADSAETANADTPQ